MLVLNVVEAVILIALMGIGVVLLGSYLREWLRK